MPPNDWWEYHNECGFFTFGGDIEKLELGKVQVLLVWYSACDASGHRLFTKREQIVELGEKSMEGIASLYFAAIVLSKAGPNIEGDILQRMGESGAAPSSGKSRASRTKSDAPPVANSSSG